MARRLLDDCFAHEPKRMPAGEALALLKERVRPLVGAETVPLAAAHGRILAETVVSERDNPGFDNAAVDGFAFAHADLTVGAATRLRLIEGRSAAGRHYSSPLPQGAALRVLTGAALPGGADSA